MSSGIDDIREVLNEVQQELLNKPHVVATGIGYKTVGGQKTNEMAIICSVDQKRAKARLAIQDLIPSQIQRIPTDVYPTGMLRAFQERTGRFRPAPGGVSIGHALITAGTLGCLVKQEDTVYLLSNNHVLANSNDAAPGDVILQPGAADGGRDPQDQIGSLSDFVPIHFEDDGNACFNTSVRALAHLLNTFSKTAGSSVRLRSYQAAQPENNKVDCALAEPLNREDVSKEILEIGAIAGTVEGKLGMVVRKSGRTTGLTTGSIQQVEVTARVSYGLNKNAVFTDQLMAGSMSQGGDSGSVVVDEDNRVLGLLFAGSDNTTVINRITNVFDALNITLL